jgi:cyclic beta-1,2-glucan glucanotransferase
MNVTSSFTCASQQTEDSVRKIETQELLCETILGQDPACVYPTMDSHSRQLYRRAVERLASRYHFEPVTICRTALELSRQEPIAPDIRMRLRSHIGYFLMDKDGVANLLGHLGRSPHWLTALFKDSLKLYVALYVLLVWTIATIYLLHHGLADVLSWRISCTIAVTVLAGGAMGVLLSGCLRVFIQPRVLPLLDFATGIPDSFKTIVVVPSLLHSSSHMTMVIEHLKVLAGPMPDKNVFIVLLSDFEDCPTPESKIKQLPLLELCISSIADLNRLPQYSDTRPFFLLHRDVRYSSTQNSWIGWERKRGKLQDLMSFVRSGTNPFLRMAGDTRRLKQAEYLVVLDEDASLSRKALRRLVGTHAHPLNHPHLICDDRSIARGYGILDVAIISLDRSAKGWASSVARATLGRNIAFDAFGRCKFRGKGCIHIGAFLPLAQGVPEQIELSHDIVESGLVRTGIASRVIIQDAFPSHFISYMEREHRWTRGDWQNLLWLLPRGKSGRQMSLFGKFTILENLRFSLVPLAEVILLVSGTRSWVNWMWLLFLRIGPICVVSLIEIYFRQAIALDRLRMSLWELIRISRLLLYWLVTAAFRAAVASDAIIRTLWRLLTRRNLLEWKTMASVESEGATLSLCKAYQVAVCVTALVGAAILYWGSHASRTAPSVLLVLWSACVLVRRGAPATRNQEFVE